MNSKLVEVLVAVTLTPGTTAPLGSVTTPEIEPVMPAQADIAPNRNTMHTTRKAARGGFSQADWKGFLENVIIWLLLCKVECVARC